MKVKNQKGFSLVEIIVTIVILSILISISLFSYNSSINRAKVSSVKSNMKTFQMTVELFASDNGGSYPSSLEQLKQVSIAKGYWKNIKNP
ncbi:MAG: type II secretion system protein, partial [Candidatus Sericytochromatia bacterium]